MALTQSPTGPAEMTDGAAAAGQAIGSKSLFTLQSSGRLTVNFPDDSNADRQLKERLVAAGLPIAANYTNTYPGFAIEQWWPRVDAVLQAFDEART